MSRVCEVTNKHTRFGCSIARRGKPKCEGGIGLKTTGITKRTFKPNLQKRKIWVAELNAHVQVKLCKKALKTIDRDGAYKVLVKAGVIKPTKPKKKKKKADKAK